MPDDFIERIKACNSLHTKELKDLYWLISSKSLSEEFIPELHFITFLKPSYFDIIKKQKSHPNILNHNKLRLGKYAEKLMAYHFKHFSEYQLLFQNIQLIDHKITKGEIDFILKSNDNRYIHLEFAIKFYISVKQNGKEIIVGPNLKDWWHLKIRKLKEHQTQLSTNFNHLLPNSIKNKHFEKKLLVQGTIFQYNKLHAINWSISIKDLDSLDDFFSRFVILRNRLDWIFPFDDRHSLITFEKLKSELSNFDGQAVMVVGFNQKKIPLSWGFIIQNISKINSL